MERRSNDTSIHANSFWMDWREKSYAQTTLRPCLLPPELLRRFLDRSSPNRFQNQSKGVWKSDSLLHMFLRTYECVCVCVSDTSMDTRGIHTCHLRTCGYVRTYLCMLMCRPRLCKPVEARTYRYRRLAPVGDTIRDLARRTDRLIF